MDPVCVIINMMFVHTRSDILILSVPTDHRVDAEMQRAVCVHFYAQSFCQLERTEQTLAAPAAAAEVHNNNSNIVQNS
jgi:hypothetical protein